MICSEETALSVAKRVFDTYSSGDQLANDGITRMLVDAYEQMNQEITFEDQDIIDYQVVLDVDNDKRVTLEDFQKLAIKYLVGNTQDADVEVEVPIEEIQTVQVPTVEVPKKVTTTTVKTTAKTTTTTRTTTDQQKISELTGASLTATKPAEILKVQPPQPIAKAPIIKPPQYNKRTQSKLEVAKRLFNQFQRNGFITEREVPRLLSETYKQFGMAYETSQEDIKSWMLMADQDQDGKVYYEDFSAVILDGLTQAGINIY